MGSFTTEALKADKIETTTAVAGFAGEREGTRAKQQGRTERSDYDIVGINANKVPAMRDAVRNYVKGIQNELDKMIDNTVTSRNKALQNDTVRQSVQMYLEQVKEYAKNLTSYMLTFSDKLADVESAWYRFGWGQGWTISDETSKSYGNHSSYTEKL